MTTIERNGVSGLVLRGVTIALAVLMFGSAVNAPVRGEAAAQIAAAGR